jgi:conserved hypothetical protein, YceG family
MKKGIQIIFLLLLLLLAACGEYGRQEQTAQEIQEEADPAPEQAQASAAPEGTGANIFLLTIPEGYTLARIAMTLEEAGICTVEEFIAAAQEGDYSGFPLVAMQEPSETRCFKLEGYLYPDTYEIYTFDTPQAIIGKMLTRMEEKITPAIRAEIEASGYTTDQMITLASIIEKEAFGEEHMPAISSVLHNRLAINMRLQCDVTIVYVTGAIQPFIDGDKDRYNAHYNTYRCAGIPAGAICNPSVEAILAALRPQETDYIFFVTDENKDYFFAATWEEHQANVAVAMPRTEQ